MTRADVRRGKWAHIARAIPQEASARRAGPRAAETPSARSARRPYRATSPSSTKAWSCITTYGRSSKVRWPFPSWWMISSAPMP